VLGDRFFLEQAFANLIVNAIQAMEDAPEKALLVSTIMNEESSTLSIAIRDTGCGIPQESLNRIFEPYFTSRNQGTGLGLHVVATIVKDHHGSVEVATDVGKGTTFTVILPVGRTGHCGSGE
jgi:two-component system sporulation sensor kinase C